MTYVNLHTLPAHLAQYTALVSDDPQAGADEIDFVAPRYATTEELIFLAGTSSDADGYEGQSILGMINQSAGYVIFE